MSLSLTLFRKEIHSYFNSPVAYVFIVVFLTVASGLFMTPFFLAGLCDMRAFFSNLPLILIIFVPAITMRLWAEESGKGTLGLLFSLPVSSTGLVLGKFLASLFFCSLALLSTVTIPIMLRFLGTPDMGPIVGGYVGSILLLAFLLSLGMAISAFFKDQIVAFILGLVAGFFCFLAGTEFFSTFIDGWVPGLGTFLRHSLGIRSHFTSFAKGVIDTRDVIFFLSYTLVFLTINVLTLEGLLKLRIQREFILGVLMLLGSAVFLNALLFDVRLPRFDLTENKIYTVSESTQKVLSRLKVPISVIYYCSSKDKMPTAMKEMSRDVGDILYEFSRLSPKFTYRIVDPDNLSQKEQDELRKKGIVPFNAQTIEKDALNIKRIYSALQLSYLDKKDEIIPQVLPDSLGSLEYDIVSKIFRLTLKENPKVVMVAQKEQIPPQMYLMYQRMGQSVPPAVDRYQMVEQLLRSQGYTVLRQEIKKDYPIPEDAKALFILGPLHMNERQLFEIRRFLASGRPVILAFQHYKYRYSNPQGTVTVNAEKMPNNLNRLVEDLGISVSQKMLFDKRHAVLSIESSTQMGLFTALVRTPVDFPMQIKVLRDSMNQNISVTSDLSALLYLWGNNLEIDKKIMAKKGLGLLTLFQTSPYSWTRPYHPGDLSAKDLIPSETEFSQRPLAVMLKGKFKNPFGEKGVPKWPGEEKDGAKKTEKENKPHQNEKGRGKPNEDKISRLILIGSSEMFSDSSISAYSNAPFLLNCMDVMCLGEDLIHIRTKSQMQRFIREVTPAQRLLWKAVTIFLMPCLWALFGVFHAVKRKRARQNCSFSWN